MNRVPLFLFILLLGFQAMGQKQLSKLTGVYNDGGPDHFITQLILHPDSTFELTTYDPVFPYTYQQYHNQGPFTLQGNEIVLNPHLPPHKEEVDLTSMTDPTTDSIRFDIQYLIEYYQEEHLIDRQPFAFELLTIFINRKRNRYNVVQEIRPPFGCLFSPRIKDQVALDSSNGFSIPNTEVKRIGLYTYGFADIIWFDVEEAGNNHFTFSIAQPVDEARTPRSRRVLVNRQKLYYYQHKGKFMKMASPLVKRRIATQVPEG